MPKTNLFEREIILKLGEVELLISQGQTVHKALKSVGISRQGYYRWRREYWVVAMALVKELRESERERERTLA